VTLGTLVKYARDQGWTPARATREDRAYGWDDVIGGGLQVIDNPDQVEVHPLPKVDKHNSVIERTFKLEGRMTEVEHDIRDLKERR